MSLRSDIWAVIDLLQIHRHLGRWLGHRRDTGVRIQLSESAGFRNLICLTLFFPNGALRKLEEVLGRIKIQSFLGPDATVKVTYVKATRDFKKWPLDRAKTLKTLCFDTQTNAKTNLLSDIRFPV